VCGPRTEFVRGPHFLYTVHSACARDTESVRRVQVRCTAIQHLCGEYGCCGGRTTSVRRVQVRPIVHSLRVSRTTPVIE